MSGVAPTVPVAYTPTQPQRVTFSELSSITNGAVAWFTGTCGSLSSVFCRTTDVNAINVVDLSPGVTYRLCVFNDLSSTDQDFGQFLQLSLTTEPTGACCSGSTCTYATSAGACTGTFLGLGAACSPNPCGNVNCCRGTTCNSVAGGSCTGQPAGSNSVVVASCGPGNTNAGCCYADFNHDGTQSIEDLFLYFNAYFTGSPYAKFGGNATAQPAIDDLFLYINAYFTNCL